MADNKKSFVLYSDLIFTVNKMDNEKAGILFKTILSYVNDENPIIDDLLIDLVFEPIKRQMKRDLEKWESKKESFSDAGKESAKARKLSATQLYVLRFYNDTEEFIKVGITDNSVSRRYSSSGDGGFKLGYKFEILYQYFPTNENISLLELEQKVSKKFSKYQYFPLNKFGGHCECFNIKIANDILQFIESFNDVENRSTKSTVTVTDTVNVTDNVTDNVINNINTENSIEFLHPQNLEVNNQSLEVKKENTVLIGGGKKSIKGSKNIPIPNFDEFCNYAWSNEPKVTEQSLKLKYKSWIENNWHNGLNKPIKNWKSTLLNTLEFLPKQNNPNDQSKLKKNLSVLESALQKLNERENKQDAIQ